MIRGSLIFSNTIPHAKDTPERKAESRYAYSVSPEFLLKSFLMFAAK